MPTPLSPPPPPRFSYLQTFMSPPARGLQKSEVRPSPWIPLTSLLLGRAAGASLLTSEPQPFVLSHFSQRHFTSEGLSQTVGVKGGGLVLTLVRTRCEYAQSVSGLRNIFRSRSATCELRFCNRKSFPLTTNRHLSRSGVHQTC